VLILALGAVVVGCVFLVVSFLTENIAWAWGCIGACGLAAVVLVVDTIRRGRAPHEKVLEEPALTPPVMATEGLVDEPQQTPSAPGFASDAESTQVLAVADAPPRSADLQELDFRQPEAQEPEAQQPEAQQPALEKHGAGDHDDSDHDDSDHDDSDHDDSDHDDSDHDDSDHDDSEHDDSDHDDSDHDDSEPDEEDVDAADALAIGGLSSEVVVVDEHPRFHLSSCPWLAERATLPLPVGEAVGLGFTGCARCKPSTTLAAQSRGR